jgi:hypothetical protein
MKTLLCPVVAKLALCLWLMGWSALAAAEKVLQNYPAGAYQYQLVVGEGVAKTEGEFSWREYPLAIRLTNNGRQADQKIFFHVADGEDFIPDPPEKGVWDYGEENTHVEISARLVSLAGSKEKSFLLVSRKYGFEILYNDHTLYGIEKGKLREIWRYDAQASLDQGKPYYSFVTPVKHQGRNYLWFRETRETPWRDISREAGDTWADFLHDHLIGWRNGKLEIVPLPTRRIPMYVVALRFFEDRNAIYKASFLLSCEAPIHALETWRYPSLQKYGVVFLGNVFFSQEAIAGYRAAVQQCAGRENQTVESTLYPIRYPDGAAK